MSCIFLPGTVMSLLSFALADPSAHCASVAVPVDPTMSVTHRSAGGKKQDRLSPALLARYRVRRGALLGRIEEVPDAEQSDPIAAVESSILGTAVEAQAGETLSGLAWRHGFDPSVVAELNQLQPRTVLKARTPVVLDRYHRCCPGEKLESLAQLYDCTESELRALNGMGPRQSVAPWQRLVVPAITQQPPGLHQYSIDYIWPVLADPDAELIASVQRHHVILPDTIQSIAERYEVSEERIRRLNGLTEESEPVAGTDLVIRCRARCSVIDPSVRDLVSSLEYTLGVTLEETLELNGIAEPEDLPRRLIEIPYPTRVRPLPEVDESNYR